MAFFDRRYVEIAESIHLGESGSEIHAILERLGPKAKISKVLDIGCGYGRVSVPLAERVSSVVGFDLSGELVAEAKKRAFAMGVEDSCQFYVQDATAAQIQVESCGQYDAVLLLDSVIGAGDKTDDLFLRAAWSALRPGGYLFVSSLNLPAVLRHLDRDGRARFVIATSFGQVVDEVEYDVEDGSLRTIRSYQNGPEVDELLVFLRDSQTWISLIRSFGFIGVRLSTVDGSPLGLDTPEVLLSAKRPKGTIAG